MEQLEGRQSVLAALQAAQRRFQVILVRQNAHAEKTRDVIELAAARGVPVRFVERDELDALAHGATHGGIIAICGPKPRLPGDQLVDLVTRLRTPPLLLLIEGVDDARNLGFTLRSADALGVHAVLIKKHLWDFDETEVARPSSGAYERVPLVQIDTLDVVRRLQQHNVRLIGCLANVRTSLFETNLAEPTIIAVGGEKRGLSGAVRSICDGFAAIPTRNGASLSLSHATAIMLAEAMRQRRQQRLQPE